MAKDKALQVWKFTASQIQLVKDQAQYHANELVPMQRYQAKAQNELLVGFLEEHGIPEDFLLTVDLDNFKFVERRVADNVIPFPVEVPDETPLTSADNPDAE